MLESCDIGKFLTIYLRRRRGQSPIPNHWMLSLTVTFSIETLGLDLGVSPLVEAGPRYPLILHRP
jgi:hypothetical protein